MDMVTKRNPRQKGMHSNVHICTQVEAIKNLTEMTKELQGYSLRLNEVTLGNGHKEDGLLFIVRKFVKEHEVVLTDVQEIKKNLSLVTQVNNELDIQNRVRIGVAKELEKKKEEDEKSIDIKFKKKGISLTTISVLIAGILLFVNFILQHLTYNINSSTKADVSAVKGDVENLGVPYVSNPRGLRIDPSDSIRVKFLLKDLSDTIY